MAISTGSKLSWADIQALYNSLNTARTKFGFSTVTVPSNPGTVKPAQVQTLNSYVNGMSSSKYLTSVAVTGVTVPKAGTLIYPLEFTKIKTTINNINNTCAFDSFDSSFNSNNNGFGFNSGFNSNNNGFGFNSGFNSNNNGFGFNSGFFSSNNGFSVCSNNGFQSTMFSGFNNRFNS